MIIYDTVETNLLLNLLMMLILQHQLSTILLQYRIRIMNCLGLLELLLFMLTSFYYYILPIILSYFYIFFILWHHFMSKLGAIYIHWTLFLLLF